MIKLTLSKFNIKSSLILADSKNVLSKYYNYRFWKIPEINQRNLGKLIIGLKKRKINFVIPSSDKELSFWALNKNKFKKNNIYVMVSDLETIKLCLDKYIFYKHLTINKILTPNTLIKQPPINKKYLIKERFSNDNKKSPIIYNPKSKKELINFKSPIYQEFIDGNEYSIDCGIVENNINVLIRKRLITFNGESELTKIEKNKQIRKIILKTIKLFKFEGHFMFQGILCKKTKKFYITECNARVGGMSIVSTLSGMDNIANFIANKSKLKIKNIKIKPKNNFAVFRDIYSF